MTKSQIEEQRASAQRAFDYYWNRTAMPKDDWIDPSNYDEKRYADEQAFIRGWLAAKQDAEIRNAKVGDIIETPTGLFQVMRCPDSFDDSGITTDDIKREFCRYCGTGNQDHLPNCKGARG